MEKNENGKNSAVYSVEIADGIVEYFYGGDFKTADKADIGECLKGLMTAAEIIFKTFDDLASENERNGEHRNKNKKKENGAKYAVEVSDKIMEFFCGKTTKLLFETSKDFE